MKTIPLTQGYSAIVDDEDYERVIRYKWCAYVRPRADGSIRVYVGRSSRKTSGGQTTQYLHRFILNAPTGMDVDHIDGNPLNNGKNNIRICSRAENIRNMAPKNGGSSKYKGVYWPKRDKKWLAHIRIDGKMTHIGYFTNEIDAAKAYDAVAVKYFGEFARLNFPIESAHDECAR